MIVPAVPTRASIKCAPGTVNPVPDDVAGWSALIIVASAVAIADNVSVACTP
ncbi:hypothetical protein [Pandoraea pnomenusa]|uniref:hypothetical protein n=1 Tax=Pandoraea pnomenusa TaxID=93220 RepID=UPI001358A0B4|nr:hypothetical protein [Pandoraea pnomenusa]